MSSTRERIGIVGVGLMGHGIAKNIIEAGYPMTVMGHRNRAPIEDMRQRGAGEADTVTQLAAVSGIVFLCLPGSPEVEAVVTQILKDKGAVHTIVDCSTCDPVSTRSLAKACNEIGIAFVDAPLARTPKEAWEGQLDTMVGAGEADFARVEPILKCWAGRIMRVGDVGAGHTVKLLNNFVALGYAALYAEVLAIGARNGVEAATFRGIIDGGRMDCGFFQTFMQYAVDRNRDAHKFTLRNAHKDMRYLTGLASESGIASHMASSVKNSFATAEGIGRGDDYVPMLADIVAELNGITRKEGGDRA